MRKAYFILSILFIYSGVNLLAQRGFYGGFESGTNFFYGSISQKKNIGFTGGFNSVFQFNNQISGGISYNFNTLRASKDIIRSNGQNSHYNFDSKLNAIDLHFYADVIGIVRNTNLTSPVKANIDIGTGLIIHDATSYMNGAVDTRTYNDNTNFKVHVGGEVNYRITSQFNAYFSLLYHYCLTSEVDGYAYKYSGILTPPVKNDTYYTTTIGTRYYFGGGSGSGRAASIISNTFGFSRFQGKKTAKESFFSNSKSQNSTPRFSGKKKKTPKTVNNRSDQAARKKRLKAARKSQSNNSGFFSFLKRKQYIPKR